MVNPGSSRYFSARVQFYLVAGCVISPFVFVLVQGYLVDLLVPTLSALGVSSSTGVRAAIVSWGVLGAMLAAAVLCLPLGWLEPRRPAFLGGVVGLAGCIAISWIWQSLPPRNPAWSSILELVAFLGGCILFAVVGAMGARRVAA